MEGYLTEIRFFGPNWAPRNWASCSGQTMPISSFNAVFSLIGTIYGGDGRTTFNLPDLRGRVAVGSGAGIGLTPRSNGQVGGTESVTLSLSELPSHNHMANLTGGITGQFNVSNAPGAASTPVAGNSLAAEAAPSSFMYGNDTPNTPLNGLSLTNNLGVTLSNQGSSQSHFNMMPYQVLTQF